MAQQAMAVATAPDGSVYVSDGRGAVRQFNDTSTWERAIAGVGLQGYGGDSGLATRARLGALDAVAADASQNVIVADTTNNRIRVLAATSGTFYGQAMTAGDIYTVAGNGSPGLSGDGGPATAAVDGSGNLLIADSGNDRIRAVSG